jgi:hypothetical protein
VLTDNDVTTLGGTSTGRLVYNYISGGNWVYDAAGVNNFVLCHTFAVGAASGGEQLYSAIGQDEYSSSTSAELGAITEINSLIQTLPFKEIRPLSSVIMQTGSYGNTVNARIRPTLDGNDYVDHRITGATSGGGISTTDHNSLTNRDVYGSHPANAIQYNAPSILTISAGAVTYTQTTHFIAAESGTADDLDTISVSTSDSYRLAIQADSGDTITVKNGTGNIVTNDGADFTLSGSVIADMVYDGTQWVVVNPARVAQEIITAVSDETTALTTGTAKVTFRMPNAMTLTDVRASVTTAPTGSVLTVDINESGTSVLSTKLTIDAGEKTSTTAATPAVISDSALADDAEITIDIDGVGSTVAGAGLKVALIGTRV